MDSQIDSELRAAALDGSVRHRADEIRHPDSDILLFVLPSHKQCVGGAAFFGKLKTRGVDVWKRHSKYKHAFWLFDGYSSHMSNCSLNSTNNE